MFEKLSNVITFTPWHKCAKRCRRVPKFLDYCEGVRWVGGGRVRVGKGVRVRVWVRVWVRVRVCGG